MTRLLAVFTEGYSDWEPALVLGCGRGFYGLETLIGSPGGTKVRSQGGVCALPDIDVDDADPTAYDGLVVPGGTVWLTDAAPDISALLHRFVQAGKPVGLLCDATVAAARAGLLNTCRHTGNSLESLTSNPGRYEGSDYYQDVPRAVSDQRVVTAPGAAPVSFAAAMFRLMGLTPEQNVDYFEALLGREHRNGSN